MSDDNKLGWILDLDASSFEKGMESATERVGHLASELSGIARIAGVVAVAAFAVKEAFDFTLEGEQIRSIAAKFDLLASSAGLMGEKLKDSLIEASKGLIDDTDLMQSANKALVSMGSNAERLGEVLDVARQRANIFGGSALERFEQINLAIASGQTRSLKDIGLKIDQEKAWRHYANQIGVATSTLSEHAKQHAIMDAVLEKAKKQIGDHATYVKEATNSWTAFKVTLNQIGETSTLAFEKIFGPSVRAVLKAMQNEAKHSGDALQAVFGEGMDQKKAKVSFLTDEIVRQKESVKELGEKYERLKGHDPFTESRARESLEQANQQLLKYNFQLAQAKRELDALSGAKGPDGKPKKAGADGTEGEEGGGGNQDNRAVQEADLTYSKELLSLQQAIVTEQGKYADSLEEANVVYASQVDLIRTASELEIQKLQLSDTLSPEQKANQEILIQEQKAQRLKNLEDGLSATRTQALNQYVQHSTSTADGVARAFSSGSAKARLDMNNFAITGQRVFQSFSGNAVGALQAWGAGQKSAGEAAKGFLFGMLADEAQARGTLMMLSSVWPPNPVGLAGGAALIALSGFLRSQGGGGGSGGAPSVGGAGAAGGPPQPGATSDSYGRPEAEQKVTQKSVSITVQGSYFETDQTKRRLVEMLEEHSDATDYRFKQNN